MGITMRPRRALALAASTALGAGLLAGAGATAPANAAPATITLNYTCVYPLINQQDLTVAIEVALPDQAEVGVPTAPFDIKAISTISANTTSGLSLIGAKTLEGKAVSHVSVQAPQVNLPDVQVPVTVAKTPVPSSGAFDIPATGQTPSLTFPEAGTGVINIGNLDLNMIARNAAGDPIALPGGKPDGSFDAPCTLKPGQDTELASFPIVGDPGENTPPTAANVSATATTATAVQIPLKGQDADGDPLTYTVSTPGHGTASVSGSTATYKSAAGYTGADSFTYTVSDGTDSATATVNVTVTGSTPTNNPPKADPVSATTPKDTAVSIPLKGSDPDAGDTLTYSVTAPAHGTATVTGSTAKYTPAAGYVGSDSFTYKVTDSKGATATNTVSVTVTGGSTGGIEYHFDLAGSSFIKAASGTVPLKGTIDADFDLATGNYEADLVLNDTSGAFKVMGFLPATAKIGFQQVGRTKGSLAGGHLVSNSSMYVVLKQVNLWGFPVGGGANCKTVTPANIKLDSKADPFNPLAGGPIGGTYTLPALNDQCGSFGSFISMFTAGPGNTITAKLTP